MRTIRTKTLTAAGILCCLIVAALASCESSTTVEDYYGVQTSAPYDPSKPVTVSSFTPTKGSVGQQVVILGQNFGNDSSMVHVNIGGKEAVLVSVKNNAIYCYLPGAQSPIPNPQSPK